MKRQAQEQIVYGLFDTPAALQRTFKALIEDGGFKIDDISLLMNESVHDRDFKAIEATKSREGAAAGSAVGLTLGGILGGVAVLGMAATGGVALLVAGPMLALATAGGLVGAFVGHGLEAEEAHQIREELRHGKAMIAVHVHNAIEIERAKALFSRFRGETVEFTN